MCDCYYAKCQECEELIPVHIEDFNYPRESVEVFCKDHLPGWGVTIFMNTEGQSDNVEEEPEEKTGWKCGIRLANGKTEACRRGVEPNICSRCEVTIL